MIKREVEKNPLAALEKGEPGQLLIISVIKCEPLDKERPADLKQTPVSVVGTKMSTALDEAMDVSMDS